MNSWCYRHVWYPEKQTPDILCIFINQFIAKVFILGYYEPILFNSNFYYARIGNTRTLNHNRIDSISMLFKALYDPCINAFISNN